MAEKDVKTDDQAGESKRLLQLIFNLSTNFVYLPSEDLDDGILDVLSIVCRYSDVQRGYVSFLDDNDTIISNVEWSAPGTESRGEAIKEMSAESLPWFFRKIRGLEMIHVPDVDLLPSEALPESGLWRKLHVKSFIGIPIVHGFSLLGFLGFDSIRERKTWSDDMILLLRMVGEFFAGAFVRKKAEEKQLASVMRYQSLFEYANDAITLTKGGRFHDCNSQTLRLFKVSRDDIIGRTPAMFCPEFQPDGRSSKAKGLERMRAALAGKPQFFEWRYRTGDGTFFDADVSLNRIDLNGEALIQAIVRDVTVRKQWEHALKESEARYRSLFDESRDAIYITRKDGTFVDVNQSFLDLFGHRREEMGGFNVKDAYPTRKDMEVFKKVLDEKGFTKDFEMKLQKRDGTIMDCLLTVTTKKDADDEIAGYQGIIRDITTTKQAEETIRHMAYHDALTGLPNRILFNDRLQAAIMAAARNGTHVVVMMLDLDKFKEVNDVLGHKIGDLLLKAVSERLKNTLRKSDTVARMGGDEFLVILPEIAHEYDAGIVASKIIEVFQWPFRLDGHKISVTTSVGVAVYPKDGRDQETIIKHADMAMYCSKHLGRNTYSCFQAAMSDTM